MSENTPKTKRLFVGGLFDEVTPEDLKQRFAKYGNVMSVDLKAKRNSFGNNFSLVFLYYFHFMTFIGVNCMNLQDKCRKLLVTFIF